MARLEVPWVALTIRLHCRHKLDVKYLMASRSCLVSEYTCRLRLIVSQTQVDFKAGEYVDPAYIAYIHDRVLRQLYKKPKCGKSWK